MWATIRCRARQEARTNRIWFLRAFAASAATRFARARSLCQRISKTVYFDVNYCDFCSEENGGVPLCVLNCPTEALVLPEGATPENTIMGKAVIDQYQCLAFRETGCRYCFDACPYEAIEMRDGRPYIIADKCNGCGACESVCVSLKAGSIAAGATERAVVVKPVEE